MPPSAGPPEGPLAGPPEGPPRQPPRRHDGRRSGSSLALWIILLVLLVGGGVAGLRIAHPFSRSAIRETASTGTKPTAPGGSPAGSASPGGAASATPAAPGGGTASPAASPVGPGGYRAAGRGERRLDAVAERLRPRGDRQRRHRRRQLRPNLSADPKVFDDAASSRKTLLARLTAMPGRAALPAALLSDLTQAWLASIAADQAYDEWANDMVTQGCVANDTSDPGYQATVTPNANATKHKTAFVGEWNPVAAKYGLTHYQQDQL